MMTELEKIGNKKPFVLPENYFDNFAQEMELMTGARSETHRLRLRPWMYAVAASFVAVFVVAQLYFSQQKEASFTKEAYDSYVMSQVNEAAIYEYYLQTEKDKLNDEE